MVLPMPDGHGFGAVGESDLGTCAARAHASGDDHGAAELALDRGGHVRAEEAGEEPVVVLAEHDDVGPRVACRVDDRPSRLTRSPHEVGRQTRGLDLLARLREQPDQLGRRRDRLALPVGDVVEGAEEPVDLGVERDLEDGEHDETGAPRLRLDDATVEGTAGRRRVIEADENPTHGRQSTYRRDAAIDKDLLTFRAGWGFPSDFSLPAVVELFQRLPVFGPRETPDEWLVTLADWHRCRCR